MSPQNILTKWNPFRELEDLQNRTRSLFMKSGDGGPTADREAAEGDWLPAVDVAEDDAEFTLTVDLPDVPKEQVKVTHENGVLTIQGEHHKEKEEKTKKFHRIERCHGSYLRSFQMPEDVDPEKINARFQDGVLTVHLPKSAEKKPSRKLVSVQ